jgi:hypothetical protein
MVIKKSQILAALALAAFIPVLLIGCSIINRTGNASPSPIPNESGDATQGLDSIPHPTIPITPTSFLSIDAPTATVTEALASAMVAMLPYSDTLLYSPISWYSPEFQFVETSVEPDLDWVLNEVTNQGGGFRAFTACDSDLCHGRLFVEATETDQVLEIQFSGYMPWRPITQMGWLNDDVLLFTHPAQPDYGYRYAINISEQRFLLVILVTDKCFAYGECD